MNTVVKSKYTLSDLANKHENKLGFVVGAGPSLHYVDNEDLKPYVNIAVNASILRIWEFCDYFCTDDWDVANWQYWWKELANSKCLKFFYEKKLKGKTKPIKDEEIVWFDHKLWFDPQTKTKPANGLVLTKDPKKPIIGARTSAGTAVHLLHILGCDPIVLLGMDSCFEGDKKYFWHHDGEPKTRRRKGRKDFTPNKGMLNGAPVDNHSLDFISYWNELAAQCEKQKVNVINASGGILEAFPRMPLQEVLNKYGDKKK